MTRWARVAGRAGRRARGGRAAPRAAAAGRRRRRRRPGRQRLPRAVPRPRRRRGGRRRGAALGCRRGRVPAGDRHARAARASSSSELADLPRPAGGAGRCRPATTPTSAVVTALADRDTLVVSDAHIHASLVDAVRLSRRPDRGRRTATSPRSGAALAAAHDRRALVLAESIYSVLGDAAPLIGAGRGVRGARRAARRRRGPRARRAAARGLVRTLGLAGAPHVVVTATLSKALGSQGGAVLGSLAVVEHLVNRARPFIFDTAPGPGRRRVPRWRPCGVLRARPALPDVVRRRRPTWPPPSASSRAGGRGAVGADAVARRWRSRPRPRRWSKGSGWAASGRPRCPTASRGCGSRSAPASPTTTGLAPPTCSSRWSRSTGEPSSSPAPATGVGKTVATAALAARRPGRSLVV